MKFNGPLLNQRWRLGPRLGAGAQAHSYLARDEQAKDERVVVVKQLHLREGADRWKKFDLFEREARVLKSLRHPGIPRFLETFESDPGVFNLVMEKAPGATLRAIATRVRFEDRDLRDILVRVLEILHYLHSLSPPVIHRDIKPANLLRAADGRVSLVDFGGVREVVEASVEGGSTVIGTFGYMAPEQLHGEAGPATDLYGLGATIVALAGGLEPERVPRKGLRMDLERHLSHVAPSLRGVIQKMVEPDPSARPASAMAVLELLRRGPEPAPRPTSPERSTSTVPARRRDAKLRRSDADQLERPGDDDLADLPTPMAMLVRVLFAIIGTVGYVGLTVVRAAILPLAFAFAGIFAKDKPRLDRTRNQVAGALDEGREGFRSLQRKGTNNRKRLNP